MGWASVRDHALSLFTFLREVVALRSRTVRTVDDKDYELVKWIADIPREDECYCVAWESAEDAAKRSESWLEVRKPKAQPSPPVPPALRPWLDAVDVADSSRDYPEIMEEALLNDHAPNARDETVGGARYIKLEEMPVVLDLW